MSIKKQEFYEGAALHMLVRTGRLKSIRYREPVFVVNDEFLLHLKYSTKGRSPWGFTFMPEEQVFLVAQALDSRIVIGLVCGSDGVTALPYDDYRTIAAPRDTSIHIACYRRHREYYEVSGPDGTLPQKIPPSNWPRILGS